jgi:peroxisomal membrane protein 4
VWPNKLLQYACFSHRSKKVGGSGRRLVERPAGHPEHNHHALIAGAIGGYFVWGRFNKVNTQINLYLLSRVVIALGKRYGVNIEHSKGRYHWFAAILWGIVMHLFEEQPEVLHLSLEKSMEEIYRYTLPL